MMLSIPRGCALLLIVVALACPAAGRFDDHLQTSSESNPGRLPELSYKRLLNDLQVTVASTPHLGERMTIGLTSRYGAIFDPAGKGGLAHLVSRMFLRATIDRTPRDIQEELRFLGATIEIRCDWDGMRFILQGDSSKFERSLLLLYQVVGEAVFNEADFDHVKSELLSEMDKPDDPRQSVRSRFETNLFQGTSYGRPLKGTKASLNNITIGDVRLFYRRFFSPDAAALIVVGSAPPAQVLQKAARIWGVWVRKDEIPFTFFPPRNPARQVILEDDPTSPAAQFILGGLWARRDEPAFYSCVLAARILQERLTKVLPTSLLTVGFEGRRMQGPFYIQGQAAADQSIEEIRKILDIVENFKDAGVSEEELAIEKKKWVQEYQKALSDTASISQLLLEAELYRLGSNYMANFPSLVNRYAIESVREAAKQWVFPGGVLVYVRGPASTLKSGLESLGPLQLAN